MMKCDDDYDREIGSKVLMVQLLSGLHQPGKQPHRRLRNGHARSNHRIRQTRLDATNPHIALGCLLANNAPSNGYNEGAFSFMNLDTYHTVDTPRKRTHSPRNQQR